MPVAQGAFTHRLAHDFPGTMETWNTLAGTNAKVFHWYQQIQPVDTSLKYLRKDVCDGAVALGAIPMITWAFRDASNTSSNQPAYALSTIWNGTHDAYIRQWAKDVAAYNKPIYLRPFHEFNINAYPWGIYTNGNTVADLPRAWERIYEIFQQENARKVGWIYCPVVGTTTDYGAAYPGDQFVDYIALDGYNFGTDAGQTWQTFDQVFGASYDALVAAVPNKRFMICEWGCSPNGGDKAAWFTDAFARIPVRCPKTDAVVYFNANNSAVGESDWRIDSTVASRDAYRAAIAGAGYGATPLAGVTQPDFEVLDFTTGGSGTTTTVGITLTLPPDLLIGQRMFALVHQGGGEGITDPAGWDRLEIIPDNSGTASTTTSHNTVICTRLVGGPNGTDTEPASYTWNNAGNLAKASVGILFTTTGLIAALAQLVDREAELGSLSGTAHTGITIPATLAATEVPSIVFCVVAPHAAPFDSVAGTIEISGPAGLTKVVEAYNTTGTTNTKTVALFTGRKEVLEAAGPYAFTYDQPAAASMVYTAVLRLRDTTPPAAPTGLLPPVVVTY